MWQKLTTRWWSLLPAHIRQTPSKNYPTKSANSTEQRLPVMITYVNGPITSIEFSIPQQIDDIPLGYLISAHFHFYQVDFVRILPAKKIPPLDVEHSRHQLYRTYKKEFFTPRPGPLLQPCSAYDITSQAWKDSELGKITMKPLYYLHLRRQKKRAAKQPFERKSKISTFGKLILFPRSRLSR